MKTKTRAMRRAHARDRSLRCESCGERRHHEQLIHCGRCDSIICYAHGSYDGMKKEERATFSFDPDDSRIVVNLRIGKCDDVEKCDECAASKVAPELEIIAPIPYYYYPDQYKLQGEYFGMLADIENAGGVGAQTVCNIPPDLFGGGALPYWDPFTPPLAYDTEQPAPEAAFPTEPFEADVVPQVPLLVACADGGIRLYHEVEPCDQIGEPFPTPGPGYTVYGTSYDSDAAEHPLQEDALGDPVDDFTPHHETLEVAGQPPIFEAAFPTGDWGWLGEGYTSTVDLSSFSQELEKSVAPPDSKYDPDAQEWSPEIEAARRKKERRVTFVV